MDEDTRKILIPLMVATGVTGTGGAALGGYFSDDGANYAVTLHRMTAVEQSISDLSDSVRELADDVQDGTADRWSEAEHIRYAAGVDARLNALERSVWTLDANDSAGGK